MKNDNASIACLDGVRGAACLLVLFKHAGDLGFSPAFSPESWLNRHAGTTGVMLFFTLSGFLMSTRYLPGKPTLRYWLAYILRRLLRIYPAFMAVTLLLWLLNSRLHFLPQNFDIHQLLRHWALREEMDVFWTIPIEMLFYFCLPAIALAGLFLKRTTRLEPVYLWLAMWIALLCYSRVPALYSLVSEHALYDQYIVNFDFFMGGVVMGELYRTEKIHLPQRVWNALVFAALVITSLISGNQSLFPGLTENYWQHSSFIAPLLAVLILTLAEADGPVVQLFANRPLRWLGMISYSVYLTHLYTFTLIHHYPQPTGLAAQLLAFATAFAVGIVAYYLVELPGNRFGKRLSARVLHE